MGACFVGMWAMGAATLVLATFQHDFKLYAGSCFVWAFPLLCVTAPAYVSSACKQLVNQLNERYVEHDQANADRSERLRVYLTGLNGGQGMGFAVFGYAWCFTHVSPAFPKKLRKCCFETLL
jgi:hypothetical protein|eukprot:COSAG01_NODE_7615_length_3125_cov_21.832122_1_plen_122_part_00